MIARIAAGLARNPAPEHRWRRVAVPVTAAVFMLLVLAGSSVVAMTQRETERVEQRTALLASKPSPTDLILGVSDDEWRGEQYLVVWIEPAGDAKPVLPPGMPRLPEPGQAVVSPALDRMASHSPSLAARYPDHLVLGLEGVRSEDELFAYVRWPDDRTLQGDLAGDLSGDTWAVRARAFGSPAGDDLIMPLEPPLPTASVGQVVGGILGFLIVPGLIVLAVGTATASGVRDHRFEVLRWIGASGRTLAALAVLETMILAVPGLATATVLWTVISPHLEQVPLVEHDVVRGDLELPWWLFSAELAAGVAVTGLAAIAVTAVRRRRGPARPRPAAERTILTPLRMAPLGLALVAFILGRIAQGNPAVNLNLAGFAAAFIGVPLILPGALRAAGAALGRLEYVSVSLAGRGLEWDPARAARPFVGGAVLLVIALAGSGYITLARHIEASPLPTGETQAVLVEWSYPRPDDPTRLADVLDTELVVPLGEGGDSHEHKDALVVGTTCRQLAPYFPGTKCNPNAPFELPAETERRLADTLVSATHVPGAGIRLAPVDDVATSGSVVVLDDAPLGVLETRVRGAAMRVLPAPTVYSGLSNTTRESPLVAWIIGGIAVALVALMIGCLFSLIDRLLGTRGHRRHLLNLGISPRRLAAIEAWLFAAPFTVVVAIGFFAGLAICTLMVGLSDIPMPWRGIGAIFGIAAVTGLVGTASVALFGAKGFSENPE